MQYMFQNTQIPAPYVPLPRFLLELPISSTAKLLYAVLLSRAQISAQSPDWQDEQGRVFQYYTIEELGKTLHRGESAILDALTALEKHDLIVRKRQGMGRANRIYVKVTVENQDSRFPENQIPESRKPKAHDPGKPRTNNKKEYKRNIYNPSYDSEIDWTGGYDCL